METLRSAQGHHPVSRLDNASQKAGFSGRAKPESRGDVIVAPDCLAKSAEGPLNVPFFPFLNKPLCVAPQTCFTAQHAIGPMLTVRTTSGEPSGLIISEISSTRACPWLVVGIAELGQRPFLAHLIIIRPALIAMHLNLARQVALNSGTPALRQTAKAHRHESAQQ